MNRIFRVIWSRSARQWIPISEAASSVGTGSTRRTSRHRRRPAAAATTAVLAMVSMVGSVQAAPSGGQITLGSGAVTRSGNTTTVQQNSNDLSLNWQSFNVASNETVNFVQPGSSAIAVNRILSNTGTTILGHLNANGQVWLINPNGVLFGKGAQVNVGGLTASTLDVSDAGIGMSARTFSGTGTGSVVNQGSIRAADGGYVALIGNRVSNQGVITARLGTIALGAGSAETLTFSGKQLIHLHVDQSTLNDLAENQQLIQADGGQVIMTAGAEDTLLASVVNNTGVVQAHSVENHNGTITLLAGMQSGAVNVGGTLDASPSGAQSGGAIETSGATVAVAKGARITGGRGGSWLIDPFDLTIDVPAATAIANTLNSGTSVTEQTTATTATGSGTPTAGAGDINVNAPIAWTNSAADLTLSAYHAINVNAAVTGAGKVQMQAANGNLTVAPGKTIEGDSGVTLGTGANFINLGGAAALSAGSTGRWLVYSTNPTLDTAGGLTPNFIQYAAAFQAAPAAGGNGFLYSVAPSVTVTALNGAAQKVYDGGTTATLTNSNFTVSGLLNGDTVTSMNGAYGTADVGTSIPVTSAATASDLTVKNSAGSIAVYGYALAGSPVTASMGTITPAPLSAAIIGNPTKVYDGTATATLTSANYQFSGFVTGQGATVNQPSSVSFGSAGAGAQTVSATFANTNFVAASGTKLSNYSLPTAALGPGTVLQAPLVITGILATDKVYDGSTTDPLDTSHAGIYGLIGGDAVALSTAAAAGHFLSANAGNGIVVTTGGFTLSGAQQADYQLVQPSGLTANITRAPLTVTGVLATNKVYDGNTSDVLSVTGAALSGFVAGDVPTLALSSAGAAGAFATKNVGSGLGVTASGFSISGASAPNYVLAQPTGFAADITAAPLTITLTGNPTKPYNGTTTADLTSANFTITGFVVGESATLPQTTLSQYASPNAGTQNVTAALSVPDFAAAGGTSMSNYSVPASVVGTGTITPAPLTGMIVGNPTKVYDSTTSAALTGANYTLSGFLTGQSATINQGSGAYASPNAGVWQVTATLASGNYVPASGTLMSNYSLPTTLSGTGTITQVQLAGYVQAGITGNPTKFYDGTTTATLNPANFVLTGFTSGQGASVTQTVGQYASANAGVQTVSASLSSGNFTANSGTDLANYHLPASAYGSGTISPAPLTVTIVNDPTRVYNGGTSLTLSSANYSIAGFVGAQGAQINPSALVNYAGPNVGAESVTAQLTASAYTADSGTLMSNYVMASSASGSGHITPAPLYVTGLYATNKVYDTTNVDPLSTGAVALTGVVGSDAGNVSLVGSPSGAFGTIHVGNSLPVTISGYSIGGVASSNYTLQPTTGLTANITPAPLSVNGVTVTSKPYDATNAATLNTGYQAVGGLLGSDSVTLSALGAQGAFTSVNVGTGIKVSASGFTIAGGQSSDYVLNQPVGLTADITPALITAFIIGNPTKVYDGSPSTTLTAANYSLLGFAGGQGALVPQSATASYAAPDAGIGINITSTLVLSDFVANSGTNLSNYQLPATGSGTGTITQAPLAAVIIGNPTKTYDHTDPASLTSANYQLTGFVGSQSASVTQSTGAYASVNAGAQSVSAALAPADFTAGSATNLNNYALPVAASGTGTINRAPLTITGVTTTPQVYNGTTVDALSGATFTGTVYGGDTPALTNASIGTLGNSGNVGTDSVTTNMGLSGTGSTNYVLTQPSGLTAVISPAPLSAVSNVTKIYDGTSIASLSGANTTLTGFVAGQGATVNSGVTGTFAGANVGTGIAITGGALSTGDLTASSGTLLSNYTLPASDNGTGAISAATLTYTAVPSSFVYGISPSGLSGAVSGFVNGESLASVTTGAATFSTTATSASNVGHYAIDGSGLSANNGNYIFTQAAANATALNITPAPLTVVNVATTSRLYDGTAIDALSGATLSGTLYNGNVLTLTNATTGTLGNSGNVGTDSVTTSMGLSGAGSGNYTLTQPAGLTAVISAVALTAASSATRSYDGTNIASLSGANTVLTGFVNGQGAAVKSGVTGTFAGANVGTGISITGGALTAGDLTANGGTLLSNYILPSSDNGSGSITRAVVNLNGARVYDAAADAAAGIFGSAGTVSGVNGENLVLVGSGTISNKNVGTRSLPSLGTLALTDGTGSASNYTLIGGTDTVIVGQLGITVTGTAASRAYNGNTTATGVTLASNGVLGGDSLTFADTSALFNTENAGTGKTVTISGISATGTGAANYSLNASTTTLADITPAVVTLTGARAYDADVDANATIFGSSGTISTGIGAETLNLSGGASLINKNVGAEGLSSLGTLSLANGTGLAANYTLVGGADTVNVSKLAIAVTGTAANKVYDGNVNASATLGSSGVLSGDNVTFADTSATFADKNVANGKTVTISGITDGGTDAGNYTLTNASTTAIADITPLAITVSGTAVNKVYDGNANATVAALGSSGVISGDNVTFAANSAAFANKNAANGKAVTIAGITDAGADAGNYTLNNTSATTTANITPLMIAVTGTGTNKIYDGNIADAVTLTGHGVLAGDVVSFSDASAVFGDKNVGSGKPVSISGITANGADGGNYAVNPSTTTAADITPATLMETAKPVTVSLGQTPVLAGTVSGFVPGDSVGNATNGTLTWIMSAPAHPNVGSYAITGTGLTAANYIIEQAPANGEALSITTELIPQGAATERVYGLIGPPISPETIATPYGVGTNSERSNNTGNAKRDPDPASSNRRLTDFKGRMGLTVVGAGVRLPDEDAT